MPLEAIKTTSCANVECLKENRWVQVTNMSSSRSAHKAAAYGSSIYIFAGYQGNNRSRPSSSIEVFDTVTNQISELTHGINISRAYFACCRLNNNVYLIAGITRDRETTNIVECFSFEIQCSYILFNSLPYSDYCLSACTLNTIS